MYCFSILLADIAATYCVGKGGIGSKASTRTKGSYKHFQTFLSSTLLPKISHSERSANSFFHRKSSKSSGLSLRRQLEVL